MGGNGFNSGTPADVQCLAPETERHCGITEYLRRRKRRQGGRQKDIREFRSIFGDERARRDVSDCRGMEAGMAKLTKGFFDNGKEPDSVRINKYLSESGMCSRREADRLVESGKVLIDGKPAAVGSRVLPGQKVTIGEKTVEQDRRMALIAFNKPRGIVCTTDRREPDNIIDSIDYGSRIFPIGRLDKESEGLILLTNDGGIVNKILRAGNFHEKEYIVQVNRPVTAEFLEGMAGGVPVLDTVTRPCTVEQLDKTGFRIILTQGLNRQIRRMCEYFGYGVVSLTRVRIMNISLGRLKSGGWRNLTEQELAGLNRLLKDSANEPLFEAGSEENGKQAAGPEALAGGSRKPVSGRKSSNEGSRKPATGPGALAGGSSRRPASGRKASKEVGGKPTARPEALAGGSRRPASGKKTSEESGRKPAAKQKVAGKGSRKPRTKAAAGEKAGIRSSRKPDRRKEDCMPAVRRKALPRK